ncbi:MAG TPA: sugar phosphate nucleotidyltransferase [Candidatus Acidoferrales bacterium]|nr:sugar phosphate nucleotidyltransferase [Candidatus Acidoferrales bacterium]
MLYGSEVSLRCGIVLSGGEGKRLEPLVRRLVGKPLPKQYVKLMGKHSMLERTFQRVEQLIPARRVFTVLNASHLQFCEVRDQISPREPTTLLIQPENKETGPGLLVPLVHIYKRYPDASAAVFPSDHFVAEDELFMAYVDMAFRMVERCPSAVVLIGIEPNGPEVDYGYVVPGQDAHHRGPWGTRKVLRFVEKPSPAIARDILRERGLWNTFVMTFKVKTMLELARRFWPALYEAFQTFGDAIGTSRERRAIEEVFRRIEAVNLSRDLLERLPLERDNPLWVLPVRGVRWSDWGSEERIWSTLAALGRTEAARVSTRRIG